MTAGTALIHVGDVISGAVPTKGGGPWGVYWGSWRTLWPWPGSLSRLAASGASGGRAERRRTPSELRTWSGRQKRARRTVLAGWDRQARQRARERGRATNSR